MSRRDRTRMLSEIVRVRHVQERAAEMDVARANAQLHALSEERNQTDLRLNETQTCWSTAVSSPDFNPIVAAAWGGAVLENETMLRDVDTRITGAEQQRLERAQAWRTALARADVAKDLKRDSARSDERAREEARLADQSDRVARGPDAS